MKNLFGDIFNLMKSLKWVDFVFIILVILLIVTFVIIIYLIKLNKKEVKVDEKKQEIDEVQNFNLEEVTKKIEDEYENVNIKKPVHYEKEQEEQAIISYDELLANTGEYHLEYDEEYTSDSEIDIKKIKKAVCVNETKTISDNYSKEEEFLKKLNELKDK